MGAEGWGIMKDYPRDGNHVEFTLSSVFREWLHGKKLSKRKLAHLASVDGRFLEIIRELITTNHLSRRKRAYLIECLGDPYFPIPADIRIMVLDHPVVRARSKDLAKHLAS